MQKREKGKLRRYEKKEREKVKGGGGEKIINNYQGGKSEKRID